VGNGKKQKKKNIRGKNKKNKKQKKKRMLVDDFAPPQLFQVDDKPITLVEGSVPKSPQLIDGPLKLVGRFKMLVDES
jgi:hypothetical protein